jgi:DNA-binding response OmpR family regulator
MTKILAVDDDSSVRDIVQVGLERAGFEVHVFSTGQEALSFFAGNHVDLAVVDIRLPDLSGLDIVRRIRNDHPRIGIIVLSGEHETSDRVIGLEIGADDYLTKPFEVRELVARVRSVLRRKARDTAAPVQDLADVYVFDGWRLRLNAQVLSDPDGRDVPLTASEFKLLECFVTHPGRVLTREHISTLISSAGVPLAERSITSRVKRLRKKLGETGRAASAITTLRDTGYMFVAKVEKAKE